MVNAGPRLCDSSWNSTCRKNASLDRLTAWSGPSTCSPIGRMIVLNLASIRLRSSTFLAPFSARTFSSFGRLYAIVCTDLRASPAVNTRSTTRIGLAAPRLVLTSSGIGRCCSISGRYFLYFASASEAFGSLTVTKAS